MSPASLNPCPTAKNVLFWVKAFNNTAKTQIDFLTAIYWQKWTQKIFEEKVNCKRYEFG